jgi:hypothetical protein
MVIDKENNQILLDYSFIFAKSQQSLTISQSAIARQVAICDLTDAGHDG